MKDINDFIGKVIQGDCIEVMKTIPDNSVDLILCDLPYGTTVCKWDVIIPFEKLWEQYKRIIKDNGAIILTATNPFASLMVSSNLEMFKYEFIWNKHRPSNPMMAKHQPLRNHEQILVFYRNKPVYNPQPRKKNTGKMFSNRQEIKQKENPRSTETYGNTPLKFNDNSNEYGYPMTILNDIPMESNLNTKPEELGLHPTQKPISLGEYLIKTYTNEGMIVLDNTCGSGSFLVSAIRLNRKWIGIEISPEYCEIARKRLKPYLEQQTLAKKSEIERLKQ